MIKISQLSCRKLKNRARLFRVERINEIDRPIITKANFDTLAGKIENYNSFNDSLALAEIQHNAKKLFGKEIPLEILQGENHHQKFRGWLMREVNPVIEFDDNKKKEIVKNPQPDNELGEFVFREAKLVVQRKFDFQEIPDGVGFQTDKGIFTYDGNLDKFYNNETGEFAELSLDMALNFAVRFGDVKKAIQAIDYDYAFEDIKKLYRRFGVDRKIIESIDGSFDFTAEEVKNFLQDKAKNWTLIFDVDNDGTKILRGNEAEKAILDTIAKHDEYGKRLMEIFKVDLSTKPKTNAEKLRQFIKKAAKSGGYSPSEVGSTRDGVELFLLSTPNVKLEQMTKLIDYVAPQAVYNSAERKFSDRVKKAKIFGETCQR